jgi:hypothetical protein
LSAESLRRPGEEEPQRHQKDYAPECERDRDGNYKAAKDVAFVVVAFVVVVHRAASPSFSAAPRKPPPGRPAMITERRLAVTPKVVPKADDSKV